MPWVDGAAPLEGKKEADYGADQEEGSKEVDLGDFLACGEFAMFALGVLEKEEDRGDSAAAERKVDPD